MKPCADEAVVLIHGIWMTGLEMRWLGNRLRACGFTPHYYHYTSLSLTPTEGAAELNTYIRDLRCRRVHILAHSLGGIVTLHLFRDFPDQPPGRVLLLGSPVLGSGVARVVATSSWMRPFLGRNAEGGLTDPAPAWSGGRDIGTIAGTDGLGVGKLLGGLSEENDGTVSVVETRLAGVTDSCLLDVSHMGMLLSSRVADKACSFLHHGRFDPGRGQGVE